MDNITKFIIDCVFFIQMKTHFMQRTHYVRYVHFEILTRTFIFVTFFHIFKS